MWRVIWDHNVPTVVMLTNLVEKMKIKCSQYWPDSNSATYGNYVVTLTNTITLSDFVIRSLTVKNVSFLFILVGLRFSIMYIMARTPFNVSD